MHTRAAIENQPSRDRNSPSRDRNSPSRDHRRARGAQVPWFAPVGADAYGKHVQPWEEGGGAFLFFFRAALCWIGE